MVKYKSNHDSYCILITTSEVPMKLIFASDSFKGTLSSRQTAVLLGEAAREVFGQCETVEIPVADGGEGTTEAVLSARKGETKYVEVHGPPDGAGPRLFRCTGE